MLTVRYDASERTFAAGNDVVIGRDLRADVRVGHPLISRAHLIVRFDQGRWVAIDNGSLNGMYVNNRRVPYVDIQDGQRINIGNPDGPALTFEVGRYRGSAGRPPLTTSIPLATASGVHAAPHVDPSRPGQPQQSVPTTRMPPAYPPSSPQPAYPPSGPQAAHPPSAPQTRYPATGSQPIGAPQQAPHIYRPPAPAGEPAARPGGDLATSMMKILRPGRAPGAETPGAIKVGRANDNDIVIPDVLAGRHHASLVPTPTGTEIVDNRSINGTFVNGTRVEQALLHEGDVVTIGNVDLIFAGGTLAWRQETAAATGTGGLDVRGVAWTIDNRKLLDDISLIARPGMLTAVIGPSGAGSRPSPGWWPGTRSPAPARWCSRATTFPPICLTAQQDRQVPRQRGARSADRQSGADVCAELAATQHHQGRPRTGGGPGYRGTQDDPAPKNGSTSSRVDQRKRASVALELPPGRRCHPG